MIKKLKKKLRIRLRFLNYQANVLSGEMKKNINFKDKTLIDLGCDDGVYELRLKDQCSKIVGIDTNDFVIKICRKMIRDKHIRFEIDNMEMLNVSKYGKFDYLLFMNMVFLVKFDSVLIGKMYDLLNKKGMVIMQIPNKFSDHYRKLNEKDKKKGGVINDPSVDEIIKQMKDNGFNLVLKKGLFYTSYWKTPFYLSYIYLIKEWVKRSKEPASYFLIFEKDYIDNCHK